ncbi:ADP-ribose pyrophosphatase YjhB, NUDIX family [Streptoalloteichus tenebrarius]|uniref:ADP-ribose pyrophosphatase YjhB, NUDIX family n=1 Tax=Streptoalloteichus tenebrarius (strain ATCC 17920 / DSM 40477 / JCM 4838 / CBS 697.72 / NBRC 16177 / NCIMB 11028 / NRRL B-12390 / A12253. 1 / ISP 5477) TaxID=1933 RepID=A0ABT1I374_STRSD|nr:NUDIX hydrolase [Streptoalloteichus tenebrarius]MCP2262242.1 ADP-ribose pyrophosphatase YjhB, NUDIX family [Streptoalloteichus tenebrarius]BFF00778.1 NUDIX hydrolase [Streptoalloteichus tenebrarius]
MTESAEGLEWTVRGERTVYDNQWVRLALVDVEPPDGRRFEHHVVNLHRVAIALVVDEEERVLTLWRYRFAVDQWGYELVGGLVEEGEEAARTAAREIEEETGYRAVGEPEHLLSFQPLPGMVRAQTDVFLWRQVEKVGDPTDAEEAARIEWIPIKRMLELVKRGEVLGAGAIVPLLYYLASRDLGGAGKD